MPALVAGTHVQGTGRALDVDSRLRGNDKKQTPMLYRHARESGHPVYASHMIRPCVYILANRWNGTLYIGVTNDIARMGNEHKADVVDGFSKRYGIHTLVYVEFHATMPEAIQREKQMKKWRRDWKIELIERDNPEWRDLYDDILK